MRQKFKRKRDNHYSSLFFMQKHFDSGKRGCPLSECDPSEIEYKNVKLLKRFISDGGRILPRRLTYICAKHQRVLSRAIKRARFMAFIPFCN